MNDATRRARAARRVHLRNRRRLRRSLEPTRGQWIERAMLAAVLAISVALPAGVLIWRAAQ